MEQAETLRPRVIYLAGLGRSGTTLVERMLGELPGVCAVGEAVHLWQRGAAAGERCGCGEPFLACAFWQAVGEKAFGGWDRVNTGRIAELHNLVDRTRHIPLLAAPRQRPAFRKALDEYVSYYLSLYTAISDVSGCGCLVDSSKHASLAFCLRSCPGIDLAVVHVVRDSRAVAYSWSKQVRRPDTDADSYMSKYSTATAAAQWNIQNGAVHALSMLGTPALRVAYEDLARDPAAAVRKIADFAGLRRKADAVSFLGGSADERWADLSPAHTASGNPLRFETGRILIRPDEAWRTALPAGRRRLVTGLTTPLLVRYGYLKGPRRLIGQRSQQHRERPW
jgi:hypothetical protein